MKTCMPSGEDPVISDESVAESELYFRGIKLFNSKAYFEAHDVLEDVWRAAPRPQKKFLQGLIQVAVALHHHANGNVAGARSLLARAAKNLSGYPKDFGGIQIQELLDSIAHWQHALAEGSSLPPAPQFVVDR